MKTGYYNFGQVAYVTWATLHTFYPIGVSMYKTRISRSAVFMCLFKYSSIWLQKCSTWNNINIRLQPIFYHGQHFHGVQANVRLQPVFYHNYSSSIWSSIGTNKKHSQYVTSQSVFEAALNPKQYYQYKTQPEFDFSQCSTTSSICFQLYPVFY